MHYKPLVERLDFMKNQFKKLSIDEYEIISEEPNEEWKLDRPQERARKLSHFGESSRPMTNAEMSLAWKHFLFLKKASKSHRPSLVLEDDALLHDDFVAKINEILLSNEWDIVFPGSGCNLRKPGQGLIRVSHPASKCTDSYLVTPTSAKKLYSTMLESVDLAIDWELNYQMMFHDLRVHWHEPPIVMQMSQNGNWTSSINGKQENLFRSF